MFWITIVIIMIVAPSFIWWMIAQFWKLQSSVQGVVKDTRKSLGIGTAEEFDAKVKNLTAVPQWLLEATDVDWIDKAVANTRRKREASASVAMDKGTLLWQVGENDESELGRKWGDTTFSRGQLLRSEKTIATYSLLDDSGVKTYWTIRNGDGNFLEYYNRDQPDGEIHTVLAYFRHQNGTQEYWEFPAIDKTRREVENVIKERAESGNKLYNSIDKQCSPRRQTPCCIKFDSIHRAFFGGRCPCLFPKRCFGQKP
jgi:hypothetical protein